MLGRSLTLMGFVSAEMRGTKVKLALGKRGVELTTTRMWDRRSLLNSETSRVLALAPKPITGGTHDNRNDHSGL
nr:MAG TPA_asm: hypothetical protein [Caudoviricetes sp.]